MGPPWLPNAPVAGIWPISSLKVVYYGSRGSFWGDFDNFEILGEAGDTYNVVLTKQSELLEYLNKIIFLPSTAFM